VAQVLVFSAHRYTRWDEAVYLLQVSPRLPPFFFAPSRSRGITFLVAPVEAITGSIVAVRVFLEVASAAALTTIFLLWVSVIGWAAPVAAFILGFSWLGLFYGSEVMPNLWAALLALAAFACWMRYVRGSDRALWLTSLCLGIMVLFRAQDAVAPAAVLGLWALIRPQRRVRAVAILAAGFVLGLTPWLIEMTVRYGSPAAGLREAESITQLGHTSFGHSLVQYFLLTDGPLGGPDTSGRIPVVGGLWCAAISILVALALVRSTRRLRAVAVMATVMGLLLAAQYLFFDPALQPRFLLPAYALLAVSAATGSVALFRDRGRLALGVGLGLLLVWGAWQIGTAGRIERKSLRVRVVWHRVGSELQLLSGGRPCSFVSSRGLPQMEVASGCRAHLLTSVSSITPPSTGELKFVVARRTVKVPAPWQRVTGALFRKLKIYGFSP
jgi:hypothetical protein